MERDAKKLRKALEATHPERAFRIDLREGAISSSGMPIARVIPIDDNGPCALEWYSKGVIDLGIDKSACKLSYDIFNT
eukprot:16416772-Heterocapsa_arctica.AAC.1